MPYIGNNIRSADDYRLIDDVSSSFDGSTTSFPLQVSGVSPVPFPKSPQQILISVNGVIQEPDPTGTAGFNIVGNNIVFSSAPTNGHAGIPPYSSLGVLKIPIYFITLFLKFVYYDQNHQNSACIHQELLLLHVQKVDGQYHVRDLMFHKDPRSD
mgnify:CR=1 FL=1